MLLVIRTGGISAIIVSSLLFVTQSYLSNVNGASISTDSSLMGYYLQLYNSVNNYRAKHTIAALKLNRSLSNTAEYFASRILTVSNSFDIEESEAIDVFITSGTIRPPAQQVVDTWYNESMYYDFNNPGYNLEYLNFTQMIWKASTSVGFGTYTGGNNTAIIAKFYPAGNIRGKFRQNVVPKYKKM